MRERELEKFLERNKLEFPPGTEKKYISVLLSDSKGSRLQQIDNKEVDIEYLCFPGATTAYAFEQLKLKLFPIIAKHKKPAVIYVWLGTCDITRKSGRKIEIRRFNSECEYIIEQYKNIRDFLVKEGCRVKFVGLPVYSVSKYNQFRSGSRTEYKAEDIEVIRQINILNEAIVELNSELSRNTLKFNCDLVVSRRGRRVTYNYSLLSDGLHPGYLLSQKWLRKLQLDIVRETFEHEDTTELSVDPQEYLEFQLKQ